MQLDVRLKKPTLVLQMWLKQVLQQEYLTDIARWKAAMAAGSIERFLVPRVQAAQMGRGIAIPQAAVWNGAVTTLVRWMRNRVRNRSNMELPRMGIGDPG